MDVAEIPMVGEIEDSYRPAKLMILGPRNPAHPEILGKLQIEREISREAKAVWRADVVLKNINSGIWEPCVEVEHGTGGDVPGDFEPAPRDDAVRNAARQGRIEIGSDDRLFEGHEDGRERVQVSAGTAVNIRNVEVGIFTDFET